MKKNLTYVIAAGLGALCIAAVSVYSCEKETILPNTSSDGSAIKSAGVLPEGDVCGKILNKSIVKFHVPESGSSIGHVYGEALIYNDTKYFYVELKSDDKNIFFDDAYMHVGRSVKDIPTGSDLQASLEKYTYSIKDQKPSSVRKFRILLGEIGRTPSISVAVKIEHAGQGVESADMESELLWIEGDRINDRTDGYFFKYEKQTCMTVDSQNSSNDQSAK